MAVVVNDSFVTETARDYAALSDLGKRWGRFNLTPSAVSEVIHRRATSAAVSNTRGIRFFINS